MYTHAKANFTYKLKIEMIILAISLDIFKCADISLITMRKMFTL